MKSQNTPRELARQISATPSARRDAVAFGLLLAVVAVAPLLDLSRAAPGPSLAPATVERALEAAAFLLAAAAVISRPGRQARWPSAAFAAMVAIAVFGVLQIVPLPDAVLKTVAPVNTKYYHELSSVLSRFPGAAPVRPRISVAPRATAAAAVSALAPLAFFVASCSLASSRRRRRLLALPILLVAAIGVGAAIARQPGSERGAPEQSDALAAYLLIALMVCFGGLWAEVLTGNDGQAAPSNFGDALEGRLRRLATWCGLWVLFAAGLALTQSLPAQLAGGLTTVLLIVMAAWRGGRVAYRRTAMAASAVLGIGLLWAALAGPKLADRWMRQDLAAAPSRTRAAIWSVALSAWDRSPVAGWGLGAFEDAFRHVQPESLPGRFETAPSAVHQTLVTGGVIGAALAALLLVALLSAFLRGWRRQRHREEAAAALAATGALLALTMCASLTAVFSSAAIPATLACVLGGGWSAIRER